MTMIKKAVVALCALNALASLFFIYMLYQIYTQRIEKDEAWKNKETFEKITAEINLLREKSRRRRETSGPVRNLSTGLLERLRKESGIQADIVPRRGTINAPRYTADYIDVNVGPVSLKRLAPYLLNIEKTCGGSDISSLHIDTYPGKEGQFKARFRVITYTLKPGPGTPG